MQAGTLAFIDGETCAGDFHAQVEVDDVILLRQFPVGQGVLGQLGFHTAHLHHEVVLGRSAFGHFVVGHVGDGVEQLLQVLCGLVHVCLQSLVGFFQLAYTSFGRFCLVLLAFLHQLADGLGQGVHLSEVVIE